MARLTHDKVSRAAINAILNFNDEFDRLTEGLWIGDAGIEQAVTMEIAREISRRHRLQDKFTFIPEASVADVKEYSETRRRKMPEHIAGQQRFDLIILDANYSMNAVIEVKPVFSRPLWLKDFKRIDAIVDELGHKGKGTVGFGSFCAFVQKYGVRQQSTFLNNLENFNEEITREFGKRYTVKLKKSVVSKNFSSEEDEQEDWYANAVCFSLIRKK